MDLRSENMKKIKTVKSRYTTLYILEANQREMTSGSYKYNVVTKEEYETGHPIIDWSTDNLEEAIAFAKDFDSNADSYSYSDLGNNWY